MNKRLLFAAFLVFSSTLAPGCATMRPVIDELPKAVAYAEDASLILVGIETFEKGFYAVKPNPAQQALVEKAIADARLALDAGIRICSAATELSNAQVDLAFADFRKIYLDVTELVVSIGVRRGAPGTRAGAFPGGYVAPDPMILRS